VLMTANSGKKAWPEGKLFCVLWKKGLVREMSKRNDWNKKKRRGKRYIYILRKKTPRTPITALEKRKRKRRSKKGITRKKMGVKPPFDNRNWF